LFTLVFRKLPEGWKIVHDHTSAASETNRQSAALPDEWC
jgi:ketosteroid isomerase-like protein